MTRIRLDQFDNAHYHPGAWPKRVLWYVVSLVVFESGLPWPSPLKRFWLRALGAKLGKGIVLKPRLRIKYPWNLTIGDHSWIGEGVWIDNLDHVHIGHHCCVSQGAYLLCGNHDYTRPTFDLITRPVILEDGSWAGAKSILGPGAVLGKEAVLSAGSVGLGALAAGKVHQGNPAQPIRDRVVQP